MKKGFLHSEPGLVLYYFFLISGIVLFFIFGRQGTYSGINSYHSTFTDAIMRIVTFLGDGFFAIIFISLILFFRFRIGFFLFSSFIISGLVSQFLKKIVFPAMMRPHAFYHEAGIEIYKVPGIDIHMNHSFPSGHTTTAFALFLGLSFYIKNRYIKASLLLLACLTGVSRVYLGQHFLLDILAGSLIGVLTSIILYKFVSTWKKSWLDSSIPGLLYANK